MTIRHIRIFIAVCKNGGVTAAAKELYLTQPAVSLAIKELEEHYHVRLFDRISRRLCLTEAGKQFLKYAEHVLSLFEQMEAGVKCWDENAPVHIGCSMTIGTRFLPAWVHQFSLLNPEIQVKVQISNSEEIERKIVENRLDFGFVENLPQAEEISSEVFLKDRLTVICAPEHPFAKKRMLTLQEVIGQPLLLREPGSGVRALFDSVAVANNCRVEPLWESVNTQALIEAVAQNIGISVLPVRLVEDAVKIGRLCALGIQNIKLEREFLMIRHKNKYLPHSAESFLQLCRGLSEQAE